MGRTPIQNGLTKKLSALQGALTRAVAPRPSRAGVTSSSLVLAGTQTGGHSWGSSHSQQLDWLRLPPLRCPQRSGKLCHPRGLNQGPDSDASSQQRTRLRLRLPAVW